MSVTVAERFELAKNLVNQDNAASGTAVVLSTELLSMSDALQSNAEKKRLLKESLRHL